MPTSLKSVLALVLGLSLGQTCFAQSDWVSRPTGSLLGGGAPRGKVATPSKTLAARLNGEDPGLRKALLKLDSNTGVHLDGVSLIGASVANQTRVDLEVLKKQQAASGLTYAELLVANSIASASGKTFEQTMGAKKNTTWSSLVRASSLNMNSLVARADAATNSILLASKRRDRRQREAVQDANIGTVRGNAQTIFGGN